MPWGKAKRMGILAAVAAVTLSLPASALGTFPGKNGKIAFSSSSGEFRIYTVDPDGSNRALLPIGNSARGPKWSPDGTKLAYIHGFGGSAVSNPDGTQKVFLASASDQTTQVSWSPAGNELVQREHYVNACPPPGEFCDPPDPPFLSRPGYPTGYTRLPGNDGADPDWSPDGSRIAFTELGSIRTVTPDGTSFATIAPGNNPSWSPGGSKIAFSQGPPFETDIVIKEVGGPGMTVLPLPDGQSSPVWSPDGTKIAFAWVTEDPGPGISLSDIGVMNADGSGAVRITSDGDSFAPDWQPIPINAYPRPKGASPMQVSLVPAYTACTSANSTHGAPLAFPSCNPPDPASAHLTTGTPDANGRPVRMNAALTLRVVTGDVLIDAYLNDVANTDLSDYTGTLRAQVPVRITDRFNTPHPGGPGAATTQPFAYGFTIPCTADPGATTGSECTVATSMNALAPGTHADLRRAVWQLGQVRVFDGGSDDDGSTTADNTVFAVQGVFVP